MQVQEAESLLGKPDGPGSDLEEGGRRIHEEDVHLARTDQVVYRHGFLHERSGSLVHHFETDGAKYVPEPVVMAPRLLAKRAQPHPPRKGRGNKKGSGRSKTADTKAPIPGKASEPKAAAEPSKPETAPPTAKAAEPTAEPAKDAATTAPAPAKEPK